MHDETTAYLKLFIKDYMKRKIVLWNEKKKREKREKKKQKDF